MTEREAREVRVPVTIHFDASLYERLVEVGRMRGVSTPTAVLTLLTDALGYQTGAFEPAR